AGNNDCVHVESLIGSVVILVQLAARWARTERASIALPDLAGNPAGGRTGGLQTALSATYKPIGKVAAFGPSE
ncbi:MAG: hypothetical protein ACTHJG_08430, partial [Rhodanobacteraceae bacterium]